MGKEFDFRSRVSFCLVSMHQFTSKIIIPSMVEVVLRIYCMIRLQIMAKMWINIIILVLTLSAYKRLIMVMESISWRILAAEIHTHLVIL